MNFMERFGLTNEQTILLFSMQRSIVQNDINIEKKDSARQKKIEWLSIWEKGIKDMLSQSNTISELVIDEIALKELSSQVIRDCGEVKIPLYLTLLELSLFAPYYEMEGFTQRFYERLRLDKKETEASLIKYSYLLEIDHNFVDRYKKVFKNSIASLSGTYQKVFLGAGLGTVLIAITAGLATPFIAGLAAPAGLAGAAAINSGLAAIGGGAIAAGGYGMAGGISVIVGGGSIFGAMSGAAIGGMMSDSSDYALREGAKLEVIMKEIILFAQKDVRFAQEMIKNYQDVIRKLEKELSEMKFNEQENKDRIKNMEKSIGYLRESLKNSTKAVLDNS